MSAVEHLPLPTSRPASLPLPPGPWFLLSAILPLRAPPCAQLLHCEAKLLSDINKFLAAAPSPFPMLSTSFLFEVLLPLALNLDQLCRFCNVQGSWEYKKLPSKPPSISQAQCFRMRSCLEEVPGRFAMFDSVSNGTTSRSSKARECHPAGHSRAAGSAPYANSTSLVGAVKCHPCS